MMISNIKLIVSTHVGMTVSFRLFHLFIYFSYYSLNTFSIADKKFVKDETELYFTCNQLSDNVYTTPAYVLNSIYIYQARNFLRYFPRDQILFVKSEGKFIWH